VHVRRLLLLDLLPLSEEVRLHYVLLEVLLAQRLDNSFHRLALSTIQAHLLEGALIVVVKLLALLELVDFFKLLMDRPSSRREISILVLLAIDRGPLLLEDFVPLADPGRINNGFQLGVVAHILLIVVIRGVCVFFIAASG
jgi:hypothetical protein